MRTCPYCAQENREGVLFCEECGQPFVGSQALLATSQLVNEERSTLRGRVTWGRPALTGGRRWWCMCVGRKSRSRSFRATRSCWGAPAHSQIVPDVDLAPYGAAEQGVSRRHAVIRRGEDTLTLVDLGSTNGTHLNGQRLIPHQPRVLRDGDEVRLGKLVFHIFFKE